ncbi:MAG TPA: cupin domain-containing protein [Longimicrobiaceae bacterium]
MSVQKNPTTGVVVELFGPTVEYLTSPDDERSDFCVMKGTIPPGAVVPLHSHDDTEDFLVVSGTVEALRKVRDGHEWVTIKTGDFVHIPGNAPHAWRNSSDKPVETLMVTTKKMGRFFAEVGRSADEASGPPTMEDLEHFAEVSAKYGYWNATPQENQAVGIQASF